MSTDLRNTISGLMSRAKADLAELVTFKSVADPKQFSPEECQRAAQWIVDAFTEVGLQDMSMSPTPDGSLAVHGHAPGPAGTPTVLGVPSSVTVPPAGPMFAATETSAPRGHQVLGVASGLRVHGQDVMLPPSVGGALWQPSPDTG